MKILLIALGIVILFWFISWLISRLDKRSREKRIKEHQAAKEKLKEEKEGSAPWNR